MDNKGSKKVLILYIYEILKRYSDANHKLSQSRIAELVQKEYGMTCDRKTVGRNINALIDAGIDIETYDENNVGYYLASRCSPTRKSGCLLTAYLLPGTSAAVTRGAGRKALKPCDSLFKPPYPPRFTGGQVDTHRQPAGFPEYRAARRGNLCPAQGQVCLQLLRAGFKASFKARA